MLFCHTNNERYIFIQNLVYWTDDKTILINTTIIILSLCSFTNNWQHGKQNLENALFDWGLSLNNLGLATKLLCFCQNLFRINFPKYRNKLTVFKLEEFCKSKGVWNFYQMYVSNVYGNFFLELEFFNWTYRPFRKTFRRPVHL